jgi:hypothetical protein
MNDETITEPAADELVHTDDRITELSGAVAALQTELETARSAEQSAVSDALELRDRLDAAQLLVREAALKYREARLAAAADVPPELVPESSDVAEIDRNIEAALKLAAHVRERVQQEAQAGGAAVRVPAGAPTRRAPDMSSMSAAEKIRIGLERLSDGNGR